MSEEEMKQKFTELANDLRPTLNKMTELCRLQTGAPGIRIEIANTDIEGEGSLEVNVRTSMDSNAAKMQHMMDMLRKIAEGTQPGANIVGDQMKQKEAKDKAKEESKQEAPPAAPILPEAMQKFLDNLGKGGNA